MNQEIEIEFKNMLTHEEFNQIKQHFNISERDFIMQENEYFDTLGFDLKAQSSALRIRKKVDRRVLTLKQPSSVGLLETHQPLSDEEVQVFRSIQHLEPGDVRTVLEQSAINIHALRSLGTLKTKRSEFQYKNGLFVLDHSFYLGSEDFECEYEVQNADEGEAVFDQLLTELHIPRKKSENKIVRFYNRKKSME